jgi:formylglycine-generating enzyme required for sulfatase activity
MNSVDRKLRVFLCHASHDKPVVRELYQRLLSEGWIDPWLDEEKLLPGQDWDIEIEKAVEVADVVIVCLSENSVTKEGYVQREIKRALDKSDEKPEGIVYIIPFRLNDCEVPRRLSRWHWIDYFPLGKQPKLYANLLKSLRVRAKSLEIQIDFAQQPEKYTPDGHRIYTFGNIEFVKVPAGKFVMGGKYDNKTSLYTHVGQKEVEIPYDYWIGRFPITNYQYSVVGTQTIGGDKTSRVDLGFNYNHPVVEIAWNDVISYVSSLNVFFKKELPQEYRFSLPSDIEWEKAARGIDGRLWPWGDEFDMSKCNISGDGSHGKFLLPVGMYSPQGDSPYGAADMAGNVWELTRSLDDGKEDEKANDTEHILRVVRGGAYYSTPAAVCCASSYSRSMIYTNDNTGFRLAIVPISK